MALPSETSIREAKMAVGKIVGIDGQKVCAPCFWGKSFFLSLTLDQQLVAFDIWKNQIYKALADSDVVGDIKSSSDDTYLYETPFEYVQPRRFSTLRPVQHPKNEGKILVPVYSAYKKSLKYSSSNSHRPSASQGNLQYFGTPLLIPLTPEQAEDPDAVLALIMEQYLRYAVDPSLLFDEESDEEVEGAASEQQPNGEAGPSVTSEELKDSDGDVEMDTSTSKSKGEPNKGLFKIMTTRRIPTSPDFPANKSQLDLVPLSERVEDEDEDEDELLPSAALSPPVVSTTTEPPSTIPGAFKEDTDDIDIYGPPEGVPVETAPAEAEAEQQNAPQRQRPKGKVRMGDLIVCEWKPQAAGHVFGKRPNSDFGGNKWEEFKTVGQANGKADDKAARDVLTLDKLWESFTNEDILGEDNAWYCSK
jgi:hypothetical protein